MSKIYPRTLLQQVKKFMHTDDILVILGARQTGKSTLLRLLMKELEQPVYLDLEDYKYRDICNAGPEAFLNFVKESGMFNPQKTYVFLDEIQLLEDPSSFLKLLHDHYPFFKVIVSGSSTFAIRKKFKDSLVGRTITFNLFPLSFQEFLVFKEKTFDLSGGIQSTVFIEQLRDLFIEYARFGGYPKIVLTEEKELKEIYLRQIVETYLKADIRDLTNIRQIDKFNRLLRILAGQSASLLNIQELSATTGITKPTLEDYLFVLENTYIIKRLSPFAKNLRKELFKRQKIFFLDTGLMHILQFNSIPETILGPTFETAVFEEFIKNFEKYPLYYWRTKDKKEIDFILEYDNHLHAIEVKLNASQLKTRSLKYFQKEYQASTYGICLEKPIDRDVPCLFPWQLYEKPVIWTKKNT